MAPSRIEVDADDVVERAARVLEGGGVVLLPTDTVYGLAVLPTYVDRLYAAKQRPRDMPIAVLVAGPEQVHAVATVDARARALMAEHWPGALTIVLAGEGKRATVGVRCPDDDFVRELASRLGPLATTSANRHGCPTPATADEAVEQLGEEGLDLVVDGGPRGEVASTVVDASGDQLVVLRQGAVTLGPSTAST
jgi:L-threonylcarbamoyladenylate synthase